MSDSAVRFPRHTKGKRPQFFDNPDIDQMMTFIIELTTEVSVLSERLNTIEHLLETKGTISRQDIEDFVPSGETEAQRMQARQAIIERVFRIHGER